MGKNRLRRGFWKFRGTLHVWRSYRDCWTYLSEYLVYVSLNLVTKLQKYTPFAYSWSASEECKKWNVYIQAGIRHRLGEERVRFRGLLSEILRSSSQFYEIQAGGWQREVLPVAKTKTIRRWELNITDESQSRRFLCGVMS